MSVTSRTLALPVVDFEPTGAGASTLWDLFAPGESVVGSPPIQVDWNQEMRRHGQRVVVSLLARGIGPDRAKDLAQEAWLRIIAQHRAGRLPRLELPGLVVTQAMFLARDDARRVHRRGRIEGEPGIGPHGSGAEAATDGGFERRLLARDDLRRALAVVDRAYPNARRVFALMYGPERRSAQEIATELGLSLQRVRQIACELRKQMRTAAGLDEPEHASRGRATANEIEADACAEDEVAAQ
jgi:DNA-directed RNA polymerase specialized sigma24 family protein